MMHLKTKIDDEVLKLDCPKVAALRSGRMSIEAFALTVSAQDPFVLVGDTIYALTEQEYYATRPSMAPAGLTREAVDWLLSCPAVESFSEQDRKLVAHIKESMPGCPACRFNRYRDEAWRLMKAYGIKLPDGLAPQSEMPSVPEYPACREPVESRVRGLLSPMYGRQPEDRKPCLDCVEKHLAQAYVLSREILQGYPEYLSLVEGHLGEAFDEMPDGMKALKDTVEFCLAKTMHDRRPFVPLRLVAPLLEMYRTAAGMEERSDDDAGTSSVLYELDLGEKARKELLECPVDIRSRAASICRTSLEFILGVENPADVQGRMPWEGCMGQLADTLADVAPDAAAIIRNRRLLFGFSPRLAKEAGYGGADLLDALTK